jgi:hypothetical protein
VQNYIFGGAYFNVSLFSRTTFSAPDQEMQKEWALIPEFLNSESLNSARVPVLPFKLAFEERQSALVSIVLVLI